MAKRNSPAWIIANPRRKRRKARRGKARKTRTRRRRRHSAPKVIRRRRRRRVAAPKVTRRKRRRSRSRRRRNPRYARHSIKRSMRLSARAGRRRKHTHYHGVKAHRRRTNPGGFFGGILAPIKQHGIGFAIGSVANNMFLSPLLATVAPGAPLVQSALKIVAGPLLASLGHKVPFVKKLGHHLDSLGLFFVAVGVNEVVQSFVGAPAAPHGLGWYGHRRDVRVSSIGPTMGSIGPTMGSIGPTMGALGAGIHQSNVPDMSYHQEYTG